jgi:hypothetical protein
MITIQPNPYSPTDPYQFTIQVPNEVSGMSIKSFMDGDQPIYANAHQIEARFTLAGLDGYRSLADYPRDGNTLRYLFETEGEADLAAAIINSMEGDY